MQGDGRGRSQKEREREGVKTSEEELEAVRAKMVGGGKGKRRKDRVSVSCWGGAEGIAGALQVSCPLNPTGTRVETGCAGSVRNSARRKKLIGIIEGG